MRPMAWGRWHQEMHEAGLLFAMMGEVGFVRKNARRRWAQQAGIAKLASDDNRD